MATYSKRSEGIMAILADRPIAYHPKLATVIGVKETVFVCQLLYWDGKGRDPEGWIYKPQTEITEETGLSRYEQETVRKRLGTRHILEEKLAGIPAKLHYRINYDALGEAIDAAYPTKDAETPPPKMRHSPGQVWGNPPNKNAAMTGGEPGGSPQAITESTTDYDQENTQENCAADAARIPPGRQEEEKQEDLSAGARAPAQAEPQGDACTCEHDSEPGDGQTEKRPTRDQLAAAAGITAAKRAAAGQRPWSEPGASYSGSGPPDLPAAFQGWPDVLARRRWTGDVELSEALALAVRFADGDHADLTPPGAHDAGTVRDWAAGLERLIIMAGASLPEPKGDEGMANWRVLRMRRAKWMLDYIFARRRAGDQEYSGFTICRPGSLLKIARLAEQALRQQAQGGDDGRGDDGKLPAISTTPAPRGSGGHNGTARQRGMAVSPADPETVARQRENLLKHRAERAAAG